MVRELGLTRAQVTSGNALSKLVVGPLFGYFAGWIVDRFGPRRLMLVGILNGRRRADRTGEHERVVDVLFLLSTQRARLCLRGTTAKPGAAVALVRQVARQSNGHRVPRYWFVVARSCFSFSAQLTRLFGWHVSLSVLGVLIIVICISTCVLCQRIATRHADWVEGGRSS